MSNPDWTEVERALSDALQLSEADRSAFLMRLSPSVRSEVESLLAADNRAKDFLGGPSLGRSSKPAASALTIGSMLEHYRIEAPIGQGGMGQVYRAHDTRLNRTVAVKVLWERFADPAARRRFQREAQLASSLNHPHIVTVHDVREFEGRQYLVTEFVDGGTLHDWVKRESRSWREIVELLVGVADSLATAHDAKILHRDIKPANILITQTGYAKLADFGLAKLAEPHIPASDEKTRTAGDDITRPGMIVGTVAYMSPERATSKVTDARSDIFSFGVVLYELLTGQRPFTGATDVDVLHAIVRSTPEPLHEDIPAALKGIVEKALEKDPVERYQSMREMVVDLRRLIRRSVEIHAPQLAPAKKKKWVALVAAMLFVLVAATAWILIRSPQPTERAALEYIQLTNFADSATSPALSPDGRMLTFIRGPETFFGPGEIYVKLLPDSDPVQLTHDGLDKMSPVFDSSGTHIAFTRKPTGVSPGETWSVPVLGGEPVRMLSNAEALSFIQTTAGSPRVLFSEWGEGTHLSVMTSAQNRSDARTVYAPPSMAAMAHRSYLSPDRKQVLIVEMDGGWRPCRLVPFEESSPTRLVGPSPAQCTSAAWSPDGTWIYFSANTGNGYHIWRQRFPKGEPEQVTFGATEEEGISFAPDGRSFVTSVGTRQSTMWVHTPQGERQITSQGFASLPQMSADGKKLYYLLRSKSNRRFVSGELWTADLETGHQQRLLTDFVMEHYSVSTDGNRVVFAAIDDMGHTPLWLATLDGRFAPRRLSTIEATRTFFGANGDIYFQGAENETTRFIYRVKEDGSSLQKVLENPVSYFFDVSPDAKAIAVLEDGVVKVYPSAGGPATFSCNRCGAAGGENRAITPPAISWSRDGRFLYLNNREAHQIYAVPLEPGRTVPSLPSPDIGAMAQAEAWPGVVQINEGLAFVGASPSVYAFPRVTTQRNIYRILVP